MVTGRCKCPKSYETKLACIGPGVDPNWVLRSRKVTTVFHLHWATGYGCGFPTIGTVADRKPNFL